METQEVTKQLTGWQRLIRFFRSMAVDIGAADSAPVSQSLRDVTGYGIDACNYLRAVEGPPATQREWVMHETLNPPKTPGMHDLNA